MTSKKKNIGKFINRITIGAMSVVLYIGAFAAVLFLGEQEVTLMYYESLRSFQTYFAGV